MSRSIKYDKDDKELLMFLVTAQVQKAKHAIHHEQVQHVTIEQYTADLYAAHQIQLNYIKDIKS